jgi:hypothetical protein
MKRPGKKILGMIIGGELYTKAIISNLKQGFDECDFAKSGTTNLRDYFKFTKPSVIHVHTQLDLMMSQIGLKKDSRVNFE